MHRRFGMTSCRDKLDEQLQEVDVEMGLVSITPRYSPKLIQQKSLRTVWDAARTAVRSAVLM